MQNISISPQSSKAQLQISLSHSNVSRDTLTKNAPKGDSAINMTSAIKTPWKSDLDSAVTKKEREVDADEKELREEDAELEATFRDLRLFSTEEAFAALSRKHGLTVATSNSSRGRCVPKKSNPDLLTSTTSVSADHDTDINESKPKEIAANEHSKRTVRPLSQLDVSELIHMKISQLESASTNEEDEEKEIAKAMKKIHKEISQAVSGQEDHVGKVNFMQRKYLEMFQEMRKQERDHVRLKKKCELLQREKDLLHREKERLQKSNDVLVTERSQLLEEHQVDELSTVKLTNLCLKLENLCRQIYRENRHIKREVQQRTDQISGSFEKAIAQFKEKVERDIAERQRLIDENDSLLRDKFQGFLEQYDIREKHFNSVVRSKDLELELAQAKLEQQRKLAQQETAKVELLKSQLSAFTKTEAELRKQLNVYVEKFKQVEETLNKSNSLFQSFRKEMEAMSKKGASLEKFNLAIRAKCDTMNKNLLEMAEERTKQQQALDVANKNRTKLEALCRALHAEKSVLRKSLDIYEARYPGLAMEKEHPYME
ncbi:hypothetical protein BGZ80_008230 [Entomortierella chlamydospora]|uniref:Alpha-taxilin n=1 Tax=Entomortierella chlamydospora TaxID=101097 RepID=A0A9P6N3Y6_9FUNG|nr:hypothetical protein BGZ80_008230 [Entomortierella chlamydospora]